MNILITGGAGFIGSSLSYYFLDRNHQVTIIDNLSTGNLISIPKKAKFYQCDIADTEKVKKILKNCYDLVIHLAAYIDPQESIKKPRKYIVNNFLKSKKFIHLCIKNSVNKFIFSSTAAVYGNQDENVTETSKIKIINPYALSKYKTEKFLVNLREKKKINYIILRYFNVSGTEKKFRTGNFKKYNPSFIKIVCLAALRKIKKITINGSNYNTLDGTPVRDYIHIQDLCDMHYISSEYLFCNNIKKIFNCGYGVGLSVYQIIKIASKILKFKIDYKLGKKKEGDIGYSVSNANKFMNFFKWKPKYNNIQKIIKSSYQWEIKLFSSLN
jgi:UDP-glucose 4-epimerase